ncbi:UNVERIFIED_CONTAM: hypothetical protein BEN50_24935 [Euhalothece sp. KZN 001]
MTLHPQPTSEDSTTLADCTLPSKLRSDDLSEAQLLDILRRADAAGWYLQAPPCWAQPVPLNTHGTPVLWTDHAATLTDRLAALAIRARILGYLPNIQGDLR